MTKREVLRSFALWCALCACLFSARPALALDVDPVENVSVFAETIFFQGYFRHIVYLRPTVPATTDRVPAIVLLHYLRGDAPGMANLTGPGRLVRDFGAWVILPEAIKGIWHSSNCCSRDNPVDDVAFLAHLIDLGVARFPLDSKRIYMAGYSDGAHMAELFACMRPEKIAAATLVAASIHSLDATLCTPTLPTPIQFLRGSDDALVPYNGDSFYKSAAFTAALWAQIDGCTGAPLQSDLPDAVDDGTTVQLVSYANCNAGSAVDFYTANGAGHTWPGALGFSSALGRTSEDINATSVMWEFLRRFSRP